MVSQCGVSMDTERVTVFRVEVGYLWKQHQNHWAESLETVMLCHCVHQCLLVQLLKHKTMLQYKILDLIMLKD